MFEAVNSVLSNASFIRQNAEQTSSARSVVTNGGNATNAPQAPYISPHIELDVNFDKAVIQIRDADTGDVLKQFPSKETLAARAREQVKEQEAQETQQAQQTSETTARAVAPVGDSASSSQFVASSTVELSSSAPAPAPAPTTNAPAPQVQVAITAISAAAQTAQPATTTVSTSA